MFYINQLDYASIPYLHNTEGGGMPLDKRNAAAAGCGPCCLCMIVENLTCYHLDLLHALRLSEDLGANKKEGTNLQILGAAVAEQYHLDFKTTDDICEMLACLRNGGMAVANSGGDRDGYTGLFTHGGHYITVVSADEKEVCVLDPSYKPGKYDEEGREGKVEVCYPFVYCSIETLKKDCENKKPAYYLFARKR